MTNAELNNVELIHIPMGILHRYQIDCEGENYNPEWDFSSASSDAARLVLQKQAAVIMDMAKDDIHKYNWNLCERMAVWSLASNGEFTGVPRDRVLESIKVSDAIVDVVDILVDITTTKSHVRFRQQKIEIHKLLVDWDADELRDTVVMYSSDMDGTSAANVMAIEFWKVITALYDRSTRRPYPRLSGILEADFPMITTRLWNIFTTLKLYQQAQQAQ